jgi:AbrB family looped-hinge helix DNA binding protein
MTVSRLTTNGRTTIPKAIRAHLGLKTGDKMRFLVEDDGRVVILPVTLRLRDLRGSLPRPAGSVDIKRMNEVARMRRPRS